MNELTYSELFLSQQAEARYTGVPSIFLRMFGCNFRCKNFGRDGDNFLPPPVKYNPEVVDIIDNISKYKKLEDFPLVTTGCDSYISIYPEFKKFCNTETPVTVVSKIIDLLPDKKWNNEHLVITGGEPLLKGWQHIYPELLSNSSMSDLKELTFETNGTQQLTIDFANYLKEWAAIRSYHEGITFSVSPKLTNSGERLDKSIKPEIVIEYEKIGYTYLKFVVSTEQDVNEVLSVVSQYREAGFKGPVYLMPVGGVQEVFYLNNKNVAELALKNGLRYSDRMHIQLYGNAWNT